MSKNLFLISISILFLLFNLNIIKNNNQFIDDESYYIPAARSYLMGNFGENYEHPPLGKLIIATGIKLFGDNFLGWRIMSLLFGTFGIILTSMVANAIFRNKLITNLSTILMFITPFWSAQSQLATLDIMVSTLILLSSYFLWKYLKTPNLKYSLILGTALGLSASIKWTAIFYSLAAVFLVILTRSSRQYSKIKTSHYIFVLFAFLISYTLPYFYIYQFNLNKIAIDQLIMLYIHTKTYSVSLDPNSSRPWAWFTPSDNPLTKGMMIFWIWPFIFSCLIYKALINIKKDRSLSYGIGFIIISFSSLYFPWFFVTRPTYITYSTPLIPYICISIAYFVEMFSKHLIKRSPFTILQAKKNV